MKLLKVEAWARQKFTAKLLELLDSMDSKSERELVLWDREATDVMVSTPCRTFEIQYRPYGDQGKIHSVEIHYENHKEKFGTVIEHDISDMSTVQEQLNKYFGLLEE